MGTWAPLGAYTVTQNSAKNAPKHIVFTHTKIGHFFGGGRGRSSLPDLPFVGRVTPLTSRPLSAPFTSRSWLRH